MQVTTEGPEMPDEPSPGVRPDPDQEGDDGEEAGLSEIAPLGPPMVPETEEGGTTTTASVLVPETTGI